MLRGVIHNQISTLNVNPLSANPIQWSNTLKQFVGLKLVGLI